MTSRAPTCAASSSASLAVAVGGDDHELVERRRRTDDVAGLGRPAVRQQHGDPATGRRPCQLLAGGTQRSREIGRPEAAEREHGVDDLLDRTAGGPATWRRSRPCRTTAPSSPTGRATRPRPPPPPTWRAAGPPSSRCDRRAGRSPSPVSTRHGPAGGRDRRPHRPHARRRSRRGWRRDRGRRDRAGTATRPSGPVPRGFVGPRRARSRYSRPAIRFASSRSRGSVAPVRSASIASTSSGSSASASSTAASSSWPTSGEICSKRGLRASSRRDVVRLRARSTASSASSPSFVGGDFSESWWPQSGRQLFPRHHRPRTRCDRTPPPTAR